MEDRAVITACLCSAPTGHVGHLCRVCGGGIVGGQGMSPQSAAPNPNVQVLEIETTYTERRKCGQERQKLMRRNRRRTV